MWLPSHMKKSKNALNDTINVTTSAYDMSKHALIDTVDAVNHKAANAASSVIDTTKNVASSVYDVSKHANTETDTKEFVNQKSSHVKDTVHDVADSGTQNVYKKRKK